MALRNIYLALFIYLLHNAPVAAQLTDRTDEVVFIAAQVTFLKESEDDLVIGILGKTPAGDMMLRQSGKQEIRGRKVNFRSFRRLEDIKECNFLFVPNHTSLSSISVAALISYLGKHNLGNVIVISEKSGLAAQGLHISMLPYSRVMQRFEVNKDNLNKANARIRVAGQLNAIYVTVAGKATSMLADSPITDNNTRDNNSNNNVKLRKYQSQTNQLYKILQEVYWPPSYQTGAFVIAGFGVNDVNTEMAGAFLNTHLHSNPVKVITLYEASDFSQAHVVVTSAAALSRLLKQTNNTLNLKSTLIVVIGSPALVPFADIAIFDRDGNVSTQINKNQMQQKLLNISSWFYKNNLVQF